MSTTTILINTSDNRASSEWVLQHILIPNTKEGSPYFQQELQADRMQTN